MHRTMPTTGAGLVLAAGIALAGQISGHLTEGNRPLPEGVKVGLICGGENRESATDRFGSYRVYHPRAGECTLEVRYGPRPATAPVVSYADPVTFDFELVKNPDGSYQLRRR